MIVLIEQLGLDAFLEEYRSGFKRFAKKLDRVYRPDYDPEIHESLALDYVKDMLNTLSDSLEPEKAEHEIDALGQIKGLLQAADFILGRAKIEPKSEQDIQKAVFEYLRILYPGARREVPIAHVIKTFKADIAIDELGLLIEIKFIDSPAEARSGCPGLFEDMFGYRGDPKWTSHFALVYLTGAHMRQEELDAEFALAECPVDWTPIVVRGGGGRPPQEPQSKPSRTPRSSPRTGKSEKVKPGMRSRRDSAH